MLRFYTLLVLVITHLPISAQDGKLLEREVIDYKGEQFAQLTNLPTFQNLAEETELSSITYLSDGLKINGYMATPKAEGVYPVIIFNRGGNRNFGAINPISAAMILGRIASWGYVVVASNYRGGGGSEGSDEFGGKDLNDILNLIPLFANEEKADTARLGIFGTSRGGMMTYQILAQSCLFDAAAIVSGPTDLSRLIKERPEMDALFRELIPNYQQEPKIELDKRSSIQWPDRLCETTNLMLVQGGADWRVNPLDALEMALQLHQINFPFRMHFFENADHSISQNKDELFDMLQTFFNRYLKPQ